MDSSLHEFHLKIPVRIVHKPKHLVNPKEWKSERDDVLFLLKKYVCALRNSGGGTIWVHMEGVHPHDKCLDYFHELVDDRLNRMIPDGRLFADTCQKDWKEGDTFGLIQFDVYPSNAIVTLDYKTKEPLDNCIIDITSSKIGRILQQGLKSNNRKPVIRGLTNRLQERRDVQVKALMVDKSVLNDMTQLIQHLWYDLKLSYCITAFSKLEQGGSFYVGINESPVTFRNYKSKSLNPYGFELRLCLHEKFITTLKATARDETIVLVSKEKKGKFTVRDLIEVAFHPVDKVKGVYILEVAVAAVEGIVFYDKQGPEAYEVDARGKIKRIPKEEWYIRQCALESSESKGEESSTHQTAAENVKLSKFEPEMKSSGSSNTIPVLSGKPDEDLETTGLIVPRPGPTLGHGSNYRDIFEHLQNELEEKNREIARLKEENAAVNQASLQPDREQEDPIHVTKEDLDVLSHSTPLHGHENFQLQRPENLKMSTSTFELQSDPKATGDFNETHHEKDKEITRLKEELTILHQTQEELSRMLDSVSLGGLSLDSGFLSDTRSLVSLRSTSTSDSRDNQDPDEPSPRRGRAMGFMKKVRKRLSFGTPKRTGFDLDKEEHQIQTEGIPPTYIIEEGPVYVLTDRDKMSPLFLQCTLLQFDGNRVNNDMCYVSEEGALHNIDPATVQNVTNHAGKENLDVGSRFHIYWGTCTSAQILHTSPATHYWEVRIAADTGAKGAMLSPLVELGVCEQHKLDTKNMLSKQTRSWCICVAVCDVHDRDICTQVWCNGNHIKCASTTSADRGNRLLTRCFGILVDMGRKKLVFTDVDKSDVLQTIDAEIKDSLFPMFGVSPWTDENKVKIELISGGRISVTEEKRKLIYSCVH